MSTQDNGAAKTPAWFDLRNPFEAAIDLADLGFPVVVIRDPSGAVMNDLITFQRRNPEAASRIQAMQLRAYVKAILGDQKPGVTAIPDQGADMTAWTQWVNNAPSKVVSRILKGTSLLDKAGDEAGN